MGGGRLRRFLSLGVNSRAARRFPNLVDQNPLVEERSVHARLQLGTRQVLVDLVHAAAHELQGSVGVVPIAWSMVEVEELTRLSDGAEQRVVIAAK